MSAGRVLVSGVVASVVLIALNAVLFPLVFPNGLAEQFVNGREPQLVGYHAAAFAATGFLLAAVAGASHAATPQRGLRIGALLGLLVALPEHLHLYAMTTAPAVLQLTAVLWTTGTWAVTMAAVGWVLERRSRSSQRAAR